MPQKEIVEWLAAKTRLNDAEERLKAQMRSVERLTPLVKNWRTLAPATMIGAVPGSYPGAAGLFDVLSWPDSALINDTLRDCHQYQRAFEAAEAALTNDDRQAVEKFR
jgi:hypothetical protein